MRVYGSSPLFNYVEMVFRSKRLFVVSVILATLATTAFYRSRTKTYNAQMVVFMTGSDTIGLADESQRGSIGYKINYLSMLISEQDFIKQAMRDGQLNRGKSELEFADFCKKVTNSLNFTANGNVLRVTCQWPGPECAQIVQAVYSLYSNRVFEDETVLSTSRTNLLKVLLNEYSTKHRNLDLKVRDYQLNVMAHKNTAGFEAANAEYAVMKRQVETLTEDLQAAIKQRDFIQAELAKTKPTIVDSQTFTGFAQSDVKKNAEKAQNDAQEALNAVQLKYTDNAPQVKAAKEKYEEAAAALAKINKQAEAAGATHKASDLSTIKESANPQYQQLQTQLSNQTLIIGSTQSQLDKARAQFTEIDQRLMTVPDEALKYKTMTADMGLYSKMQDDLRAELETAHLSELRDKELKTKEMRVEVQPEAEAEVGGARTALLLGAGPILGLIVAFCFSLLAESLDHSIRTPMEVETFLNKPVLAVLPRMDAKKANKNAGSKQLSAGDNDRPSLPS